MTIWRAARYRAGSTRLPGHIWQEYDPNAEPQRSRLERALSELGVAHYLPVELVARQHKRHKRAVVRRTPLMSGYVFLADPFDYAAVERLSCVNGFVRLGVEIVTIRERDIERIKQSEMAIAAQALAEIERLSVRKATRAETEARFPAGMRTKIAAGHWLSGEEIEIEAVKGRDYIKAMVLALKKVVELPISALDSYGDAA